MATSLSWRRGDIYALQALTTKASKQAPLSGGLNQYSTTYVEVMQKSQGLYSVDVLALANRLVEGI